eukprot:m.291163 g.291163  ORF g.291163 m.291163 type:complete len:859 (+) comp55093_c0_seq1:63-2639(+)
MLALAMCALAAAAAAAGPGLFDLYYFTPWNPAYLHYDPDNLGWNSIPGAAMAPSQNASFPSSQWQFIEVAANSVVFVTTNGQGQWDNNGGRNYVASQPGIYSLQNGDLQLIQAYPPGCPGTPACSGNGTCNATIGQCTCFSGYWGPECLGICPGGVQTPCEDHGVCQQSTGQCQCETGWASCTSLQACETNVSSDPENCGACGKVCQIGPGVQSAVCANSTCTLVCDQGYTLCDDNTCELGNNCPLPGCETYTDNQCSGDVIITPNNFTAMNWQTPDPTNGLYRPSYQSFFTLQGSLRVVYDPTHTLATVTVVTIQKVNVSLSFTYNGVNSTSNVTHYSANQTDGYTQLTDSLYVTVAGVDGSSLIFDPIDFLWTNPVINLPSGDYRDGQKGAIVELFGWPHDQIEQECAFLAQAGYMGAKVYPPQEQVMSTWPFQTIENPWYFMYQPVSYRLQGRMGSREALRQMIQTCRSQNVRVYADAVMNHMVGSGNDGNPYHRDNNCNYFPEKNTSAFNSTSPFYTQGYVYQPNWNTGLPPQQEFPSVPWGPVDFHCERALNSWTDPLDLNAGWLTGLVDLNTERPEVQQRLADYITDLLGIGFSGIRMDAAKHIQPDDIVAIYSKLKINLGGNFPPDFVVWMEVLLGGEAEMLLCDTDSGYNYGAYLVTAFQNAGFTDDEISMFKIWYSAYPKETDVDCGMVAMNRLAIQNDDADQQQPGSTSRDMGSDGTILVIDRDVDLHRQFEVQLFQNPFGVTDNDNDYPIRMVLSSFYFDDSQQTYGIPDGLSNCDLCTGPFCDQCVGSLGYIAAYQANSTGYDGPGNGIYSRCHRDETIINAMRAWMDLPPVSVRDIVDGLIADGH